MISVSLSQYETGLAAKLMPANPLQKYIWSWDRLVVIALKIHKTLYTK